MRFDLIRRGALVFLLACPLGGCLETVGRPPYNYGPTPPVENSCRSLNHSAGEVVGYGCNPRT
jgi:hypothetical protein